MRHDNAADPSQLTVSGGPTGPEGYLQPQPMAIHFVLTLPVTRIGVGVFSVDILEQLLGFKLEDILRPMMTGPAYQRPSMAGPAVNCYPMALPVGEGLSLNLNSWGELGMHNQEGLLCLSVPLFAASWMTPRLAHVLVRGPEQGISATRTARVALYWIRLVPGMRASVPVSVLGEVGVEAG